jgi:D-alanyl-D-alanine carboxypeptidase
MKYFKMNLVALFSIIVIISSSISSLSYSAKSVCLYDPIENKIVYGYNENQKMLPASITKIVTAITAMELGDVNQIITIDEKSAGTEGSSIYLKVGEQIPLIDLMYGMMLHSGNDAANAIAHHFGYDQFIIKMNETILKAGATSSNFENPSGLDGENHFVTAFDMAKITAYALKNPTFAQVVSTKKITLTSNDGYARYLKNHNKLLWLYQNSNGVKTGFTKKAGRTLVTSVKENNRELICVTLNAPDDWNDHISLYKEYLK